MILGITGGVGCGKSTVLNYLKERYGAILIECDEVARQLQQPGEACYGPMLALFEAERNPELLQPNGSFVRSALARIVFSDEGLRRALNGIVHPAVKERVREMIRSAGEDGTDPLIVIEAALLLEDNYGEICNEIWYIHADEDKRRQRLKDSRGYSEEKITDMLSSQRTEESYRSCCSLTIDNSSDNLQNTFRQLDEALAERGILPSFWSANPGIR